MTWGLMYSRRRLGSQEPCLFYWLLCSSQREKPQSLFALTGTCHSGEPKATSLRCIKTSSLFVCKKRALGASPDRPERQVDPSKNRKTRTDAPRWAPFSFLSQQVLDLSKNPKHSLEKVSERPGKDQATNWGINSRDQCFCCWVISSCCMWIVCSQQLNLVNQIIFLHMLLHIFVSLHKGETSHFLRIPPYSIIGIWQA